MLSTFHDTTCFNLYLNTQHCFLSLDVTAVTKQGRPSLSETNVNYGWGHVVMSIQVWSAGNRCARFTQTATAADTHGFHLISRALRFVHFWLTTLQLRGLRISLTGSICGEDTVQLGLQMWKLHLLKVQCFLLEVLTLSSFAFMSERQCVVWSVVSESS